MKQLSIILFCAVITNITCPSAHAGLLTGAAKGIGKGTKAVAGCADRGVKGVGKGAKTVVVCAGKGVKSTCGGVGKATKTVF